MTTELTWFKWALKQGAEKEDACVFAYIMSHRFPEHTISLDGSVIDYVFEWLERVKYKKYPIADSRTLKIWKTAENKCIIIK